MNRSHLPVHAVLGRESDGGPGDIKVNGRLGRECE